MSNADLIRTFYGAFARRDGAAMGRCYDPAAQFEDPVFTLSGWQVPAMWRMLCERASDLRIELGQVRADDVRGSARWEAWYTFSATGRPVHNVIEASFTFGPGRIVTHRDRFNLYRWAGQALGWPGILFGWTPVLHRAIRRRSAAALRAYAQRNGLGPTP